MRDAPLEARKRDALGPGGDRSVRDAPAGVMIKGRRIRARRMERKH